MRQILKWRKGHSNLVTRTAILCPDHPRQNSQHPNLGCHPNPLITAVRQKHSPLFSFRWREKHLALVPSRWAQQYEVCYSSCYELFRLVRSRQSDLHTPYQGVCTDIYRVYNTCIPQVPRNILFHHQDNISYGSAWPGFGPFMSLPQLKNIFSLPPLPELRSQILDPPPARFAIG